MEDDQSWIDQARTMFDPAPQSIADSLLAKVFGNWVLGDADGRGLSEGPLIYNNFLGMDEVTLVSTILGYSGILAAAFGLIISSYTFLMQMVKNSWNGTFSADGVNSIFWPLRSVAAMALIIPVVTIGDTDTGRTTNIATAQVFMMDIARAGSAFADTVSAAYVTNAFAFPVSNHRPPDTPRAVFEMIKIASCSVISARKEGQSDPTFAQVATASNAEGITTFVNTAYVDAGEFETWKADLVDGSAQQFGSSRSRSIVSSPNFSSALDGAFTTDGLTKITFGNNGACGSIEFAQNAEAAASRSNASSRSREDPGTILGDLQARVAGAYIPVYQSLSKAIFTFVEADDIDGRMQQIVEESGRMDASESPEAAAMHSLIIAFNQNLYDKISSEIYTVRDQLGGSMFGPIIDGGWAALGAVYSVIPRISNLAVNNMSDAHGQISATAGTFPCVDGGWKFWTDDCEARDLSMAYYQTVIDLTKKYRSSFNDENRPKVAVLDYCTIDQCSLRSVQSSTAKAISQTILSTAAAGGQWANTSRMNEESGTLNAGVTNTNNAELGDRDQTKAQDPSPTATLSAIGSSMTFVGAVLQASQFTAATLGNTVEALSSAGGVSGVIVGVSLSWVKTALELASGFLLAMSQTLLISGFFLSYVLPMIPFMIFGMQVIGWLATTAEGMFAVCFAVSLLTNSDGDGAINTGFLKALSLTAAIFLKPFFIVVGVALANAIAAPAFAFYNEQFWLAWDMDNAIGGNVSNVLFEMSAQLILYIVGAAILVKFVYSIQHIVPDSMNNWISGGIVNPFGVQGVADNVQADLKTNAGSMTSAGVGAASAVAKKRNES
jgi:conjugal transfer/type IV secretion protein DotA/TraY